MSFAARAGLLLASLVLAHPGWAKGVTVKIEIAGSALAEPLAITDPAVVEQFSIWSGPGSGPVRDGIVQPDYEAAFIDFRRGPVDGIPDGLVPFEVRFYVGPRRGAPPLGEPYVIRYAIDPEGSAGYMYLPDSGTRYIVHGVEENWFRSAPKWEQLVRPLIDHARVGNAGRP